MSFFSGFNFFVYLFILLIPAVVIGLKEKSLNLYRKFLSVLFIFLIYRENVNQFIYLLIYSIGSVYLIKIFLFCLKKELNSKFLLWSFLLIAIIPLGISKWCTQFGGQIFCFLGISYICFRVVQVLLESYDGLIKEINVLDYLEFILFFPSLSSGPIDRSRRFIADAHYVYTKDEYEDLLFEGFFKLILGMFYKIVLSALFYKLLNKVFANNYNPLYIIGYAYTYGFYMFFDFAGYSSMAVGVSYILGIKMPDNFNKPFISIDLKDFWNRWHITLSHWFRDFVFSRFTMNSLKQKWFSSRLATASVGLIINMAVMGIWHGFTPYYITYGLYHGIILAITEIFQKKSAFYKKNKDTKWYKIISWFVTINLVMFGFLIFSGYVDHCWIIVKNKIF